MAIPYNPYEPKPYERWTLRRMLDLQEDRFAEKGFWEFLGGEGAYPQLLDALEQAGIELRSGLDAYFGKYAQA
ncbi:MAG: TdeIII family type II restriction endonuclease [Anaerolineales bacterium]|nr:TdeIII family type II restriction endonuclease [Anaerolineales bacterium]MDW8162787.1 TdeIII family type II restriction endonuclease [Anaerolineales bacterium]